MLVLPCGWGKTKLAISMIVANSAKKTLWITPPNLETQTFDALTACLDQQADQHDSSSSSQQQDARLASKVAWLQSLDDASKVEAATVVLVSHTKLATFQQVLESAVFKRVIVGELLGCSRPPHPVSPAALLVAWVGRMRAETDSAQERPHTCTMAVQMRNMSPQPFPTPQDAQGAHPLRSCLANQCLLVPVQMRSRPRRT